VNRLEGEACVCNTGRRARVSSHFAASAGLRGRRGSGTIYRSGLHRLDERSPLAARPLRLP